MRVRTCRYLDRLSLRSASVRSQLIEAILRRPAKVENADPTAWGCAVGGRLILESSPIR